MSAKRYDSGKPRLDLMPLSWVERLARPDDTLTHDISSYIDNMYFGGFPIDSTWSAIKMIVHVEWGKRHSTDYGTLAESVARVMESGEEKYDAWNWIHGMKYSTMMGCINRHLYYISRGQHIDPESKEPHLAHVVCNMLMLCTYDELYGDKFNDFPHVVLDGQEAD